MIVVIKRLMPIWSETTDQLDDEVRANYPEKLKQYGTQIKHILTVK